MENKFSVYLETTIPSFLTARPSNNLVVAGKQEVTRQWWEKRKEKYALYISQYVLDEAARGNPDVAKKRMVVLEGIDLLEVDEDVIRLARVIIDSEIIPQKASTDAGHIAVATRHGIDFLITWNCTHIANAEILCKINYIVSEAGYHLPTICTLDELFGGEENEG
ncbi:MAG: type II toxin-antitoxin system VapC family toxin [Desulfobacteria bacterium]